MTDASIPVEEVHLQYHLSPQERIVSGLLFGRRYRVYGPLGALLCTLSPIPSLTDWSWAFVTVGLTLLLSFIWLPFALALHQRPVDLRATAEGLEFDAGTTQFHLPWRGVRRTRLLAGYFAVGMAYGTIAIPCRTLQPAQLALLQSWFAASRATTPKQETVQPPSAEDGSILSVTHEARLFDILLALAWRPVNAAFVLLGLGVVAVSIRNTTIAPGPGYDPQSYWPFVGFGLIVMLMPIWSILLRAYLGGSTRALADPFEIEIDADGLRASNDQSNSRVAWSSFRSSRRVRKVMVFRMKGSSSELYLSTRGFSPAQLAAFRAVLGEHGLDPG
jgi:hypothetical protein